MGTWWFQQRDAPSSKNRGSVIYVLWSLDHKTEMVEALLVLLSSWLGSMQRQIVAA
jgi:hypothetical protein